MAPDGTQRPTRGSGFPRRLAIAVRILNIDLTDFFAYEQASLDLTVDRSVVLTGEVGAGKTTWIEALTWVLWDRTRAPHLDKLIRDTADQCTVRATLDIDGSVVEITRSRVRGRDSVLTLVIDGVLQSAHTSQETKAKVAALIGISYEAALAGPVMLQSSVPFMRVAPRERKNLLMTLFGLDEWQRWADAARAIANEADAEANLQSRTLQRIDWANDAVVADAERDVTHAEREHRKAQEFTEQANGAVLRSREAVARLGEQAARVAATEARLAEARSKYAIQHAVYKDAFARIHATADDVGELERKEPDPATPEMLAKAEAVLKDAAEDLREESARHAGLKAIEEHGETVGHCPHCGKSFLFREAVEYSDDDGRTTATEIVAHARVRLTEARDVHQRAADLVELTRNTLRAREKWERDVESARATDRAAVAAWKAAESLLTELAAQGRAAKAEFESVKDALTDLDSAQKVAAAAERVLEEARGDEAGAHRAVTEARLALERAQVALNQRVEAQDAFDTAVAQRDVHKVVAEMLGRDGAPTLILRSLVPQIEERANAVFARMGAGMVLRVRTDRTTQGGKPLDQLDVAVEMGGELERDYEMLSGGQQFRVDLAIRMALTGLLATRTVDFLLVDEGLDRFQDDAGRRAVLDTLTSMKDGFSLIFAISHHPEVQEWFDRRVAVALEGGVSRLAAGDQ